MTTHARIDTSLDAPKHRRNYFTTPQGADILFTQTVVAVVREITDDDAIVGAIVAYESDFDLYLVATPLGSGWCRDSGLGDDIPLLVYVS